MSLRVTGIRLGLDEAETTLPEHLGRIFAVRPEMLRRWRILRKSLDARDKGNLHYVYSVEVGLDDEVGRIRSRPGTRGCVRIELYEEEPFSIPRPGSAPLAEPPVVVGSGPAGLVAAFLLAEQGYRPIVVERGRPVRDRILDVRAFDAGGPLNPESNYLFGEGGAGTFSDGKLTCRGTGPDVRRVLELLAECKGKPSILYEYRPHLGSNRLPAVVKALRRRIERLGGSFRFSCRVEDFDIRDGKLHGLATSSGFMPSSVAILAIGHSARDTYAMLHRRGVPMVPKAFQIGVRIEQPQENVNRAQYGPSHLEDRLGAADYALVARGPHDLFTFCMCAGGHVIPSVSEPGYFCTNGMSLSRRSSPFANSGLMITLTPEHFEGTDVFAGIRLQQVYEQKAYAMGRGEYLCPIQAVDNFLAGRATASPPPCSHPRGVIPSPIEELVPPVIRQTLHRGLPILDRRWHGRFLAEATLVGPEARGSAPVRLVRDPVSRECPGIEGLYPVGEGAGYAGGIVSAAVDGLRSAKAIIKRYATLGKE